MPRCPLCKSAYPAGTRVCSIDGAELESDARPQAPGGVPMHAARQQSEPYVLSDDDLQPVLAAPAAGQAMGKGASLASMTDDELTAAAKPDAMAARARGTESPRIAHGSGMATPGRSERPAWPKGPSDAAPSRGLDANAPESWLGQSLGSYKLLSILGKGGMGCVYRAEHERLGREVALKVLRSDYSQRKDAVARFFQEARAVNKIRHRNIVDITDFVELPSGIVFIIMEYLEGAPLTRSMRSKAGLEPVRALGILIQICDGLAAAHSVGIVHRDLKPDNIMIARDHRGADLVKLLDFGVAKLLDKGDDDEIGLQTVVGSVVGTPAFMSPEQAGGMDVDGRADLYSLGAIMYEMFTRQPLFRGKSFGEFVRKHLNETPTRPSLTKGGKNIHPRAEEVILKCIEKRPEQRFQTAQELRTELLSLLATLETTGEMTASLRQVQPSAAPIGEARPRGMDSSAQRSPFYQMQEQQDGRGADSSVNQVLVSGSAERSSPGLDSHHSSAAQSSVSQSSVSHSSAAHSSAAHSSVSHSSVPPHMASHASSPGTVPPHSSSPGTVPPHGMTPHTLPPQTMPPQTMPPQTMPPQAMASEVSQGPLASSGMHVAYPQSSSPSNLLAPNTSASSKRNLKVAGIAAGVALLGGALLFVSLRGKNASSEESTDADATVTAARVADEELAANTGVTAVPLPDAAPGPVVQPLIPNPVVVAMTSEPAAEVFAAGAVTPICTTPCDLSIDIEDGGSKTRRDFVLRTEGHSDETVTIDLRAPRAAVNTAMTPIAPVEPEPVEPEVTTPPETGTQDDSGDKTTPRTKLSRDKKPGKGKQAGDKPRNKKKPKCKVGAQDTFNPFGDDTGCK